MDNHITPQERFRTLARSYTILPSLLACNFANIEKDIRSLESTGAQAIHLDIMDGHFVPNLSFGIPVVEAIRRITNLVLDIHLMLSTPNEYIEAFHKAGADGITFHVEAIADLEFQGQNFARNGCTLNQVRKIAGFDTRIFSLLHKIHKLGMAAGLSVIPPTEIEVLEPYLNACDNILVMSVMPGFGGQSFDCRTKEKLSWLHKNATPDTLISVDGGVNEFTIQNCKACGATGFITGTAIFKNNQIHDNYNALNTLLQMD